MIQGIFMQLLRFFIPVNQADIPSCTPVKPYDVRLYPALAENLTDISAACNSRNLYFYNNFKK